jgi:hyperosmotically inducible periplasmic protein
VKAEIIPVSRRAVVGTNFAYVTRLEPRANLLNKEETMRFRSITASAFLAAAIACAPSDAGVTATVKSKLAADDFVRARNINVDTKDRVVTLTGEVRTEQEKTIAIDIAKQTTGVTNVVDNLSVSPELQTAPTTGRLGDTPDATERVAGDAAITADVKSRLLADTTVGGLKIDVDTKNGVVELKGEVDSQTERDRALDVARRANGVVRIEDKLEIKRPSR